MQQRVKELLAALELTDSGKTLAEYSTGMRKRVAFAAAMIHSPEMLFLDEPFESIDPAGVALLKQWLRRFTEQGRTVFMTSHVLETVERLCDRRGHHHKAGKAGVAGRHYSAGARWHGAIRRARFRFAGGSLPAPHRSRITTPSSGCRPSPGLQAKRVLKKAKNASQGARIRKNICRLCPGRRWRG